MNRMNTHRTRPYQESLLCAPTPQAVIALALAAAVVATSRRVAVAPVGPPYCHAAGQCPTQQAATAPDQHLHGITTQPGRPDAQLKEASIDSALDEPPPPRDSSSSRRSRSKAALTPVAISSP
jgi:hypothetical protein